MKKTLAIIGSGHLGQQIANYAIADHHYNKVVFYDDFTKETEVNGFKVLGNSDSVLSGFKNNEFDELLIGIGYKYLVVRKQLFERFSGIVPFGKIVHSTSWVDAAAIINEGCIIYPSCCIDANAIINANTILNIACTIAHDTVIEKHCFLSPRVALAGFIKIEEMCILGINTTVIDNITIKSNTKIGGGTVVISSIDKDGLYVGNPQRYIR